MIGVGRARDLLDPVDDLRGVVDRDRRRLAGGEPAVEVGDEVAQALIGLDLLAHELPHADRHVDQRADRIDERVDQALGGLGQRRSTRLPWNIANRSTRSTLLVPWMISCDCIGRVL